MRVRKILGYVVPSLFLLVFTPVTIAGASMIFHPVKDSDAFGAGVGFFITLIGAAFVLAAVEGMIRMRERK